MSYRKTPATRPASCAMSRGTAMSIRNSGRPRRSSCATSTSSRSTTTPGAPVPLITMSAAESSPRSASKGAARPPRLAASCSAFSKVRPPSTEARAPRRTICRAASSLILPAPTSSTERPPRSPKILVASSTATCETDTAFLPIAVSLRARLAAEIERVRRPFSTAPRLRACSAVWYASFTWPRICDSPSTIESRLAATRKACRTAGSPSSRYRCCSICSRPCP